MPIHRKNSKHSKPALKSARYYPLIEALQDRCLLSASSIVVEPNLSFLASTTSTPTGYTPAQIKAAYGFSSSSTAGAGETIAIVDAYNDPNISTDLATFDKEFGLAAPPSLQVVSETGSTTKLPQNNASWDLEISLDVEWAHAIAPDANILLVEANSASLNDLLSAVSYAKTVSTVATISMSWGGSEFQGENSYDSIFTTPAGHQGITFVAASGDEGSDYGPEWPATSPNVLAVGGTTLNLTSSGAYVSETSWNDSTGGVSALESEPAYQGDTQTTGRRSTPDVSFDANPSTGVAVYDSVPQSGTHGWYDVGGTSAGAPQWAALIAVADSARGASLDGATQAIPALYAIYGNSSNYSTDFNDITSGSSGRYSASKGYDAVTGLGTPKASAVIAALASFSGSSSTTTATQSPPTTSRGHSSGGALRRFDTLAAINDAALVMAPVSAGWQQLQATAPSTDLLEGASTTSYESSSASASAGTANAGHKSSSELSLSTPAGPVNVSINSFGTLPAVSLTSSTEQYGPVYPLGAVEIPANSARGAQAEDEASAAEAVTIDSSGGQSHSVVHACAAIGSNVFSPTSIQAAVQSVGPGRILVAVVGGIAAAAFMIKEKQPKRDEVLSGFIYNMGR